MSDEIDVTLDGDAITESTDSHEDGDMEYIYADDEKARSRGSRPIGQRGDSSDEIDPRKLVSDPSLSEIRWYYRRTFAKKLVNKPIEDAFKNGFHFKGTARQQARRRLDETDFIEEYMRAEKKARRDGFALLFIGTEERNADISKSPIRNDVIGVKDISHLKTLTVDDLRYLSDSMITEDVVSAYDHIEDEDDFEVRKTGIVIDTKPMSEHFRDPLGYVLDTHDATFIHRDRVMHLTWNREVDGNYDHGDFNISRMEFDDDFLGKWEGDSILVQSYDLLKGLTKGNWSVMQALYRNAANMYAVWMPEDADDEDYAAADSSLRNMNAMSEIIFPTPNNDAGYDMEQFPSDNQLEPQEYFDVIFDQICAGHEMTKSVLFGTQVGTVSGSEIDIKNYFNKVERYRQGRGSDKILEFLNRTQQMLDGRVQTTDYEVELDIDWKPMFTVSETDRVELFVRLIQGLNTAIGGFLLTPDEARSVIAEDWAEDIGSDVLEDIGDMTEDQFELLEDLNLSQVGQSTPEEREEASKGSPQEQAEGSGMQQGQSTGSNDPTSGNGTDALEAARELGNWKAAYITE
jgi:hypothetical protein